MGRKNLLDKCFSQIEYYFDNSNPKSFTYTKLREILGSKRNDWNISPNRSTKNIINYLVNKDVLFLNPITNTKDKPVYIYTWKTTDSFTIISGIRNKAYFAFYSALYLHGLTLQIPKTFYINHERVYDIIPNQNTKISQQAIHIAFSKAQRKSKIIYRYKDKKILVTNGKHSDRLGVYPIHNLNKSDNNFYYCTDLERTLIDISVRPVYSGGVFEVLEAFKLAKERVNLLLLKDYLEKLNYIYPYEQVIGFYLEKAGYNTKDCSIFNTEKTFEFYLTYEMRNKLFSTEWNLYFPKGM